MRIAAVYNRFVRSGGLEENYLSDFIAQLLANGYQVDVITGQTDSDTSSLPPETRVKKLRTRALTPASRLRGFNRGAAQAVDELAADVSIGFGRTTTHDLHRAGGGCHHVYSDLLPLAKRLGPKNRAELALERALYTSGKTRHFICNSQMVAGQISQAYGVPGERISIVRTPVDHARFHPSSSDDQIRKEICAELRTEPSIPVLLFVSLGHRRKGIDAILRALPQVDDAHLWIIGSRLESHHVAEIERRQIGHRIFHLGRPSDPAPYYRAADFFLHPTLYDACANTALDSMASGLPGLISIHDGAHELVVDGRTGFLLEQPDNPEYLAATIAKALALDTKHRKSLGEAARQQVLPLTWENHLQQWFQLIEGLLSCR
jgi:glycosyltransferase involved in cell wall biosynthesis